MDFLKQIHTNKNANDMNILPEGFVAYLLHVNHISGGISQVKNVFLEIFFVSL